MSKKGREVCNNCATERGFIGENSQERLPYKQEAVGSSPTPPTSFQQLTDFPAPPSPPETLLFSRRRSHSVQQMCNANGRLSTQAGKVL